MPGSSGDGREALSEWIVRPLRRPDTVEAPLTMIERVLKLEAACPNAARVLPAAPPFRRP